MISGQNINKQGTVIVIDDESDIDESNLESKNENPISGDNISDQRYVYNLEESKFELLASQNDGIYAKRPKLYQTNFGQTDLYFASLKQAKQNKNLSNKKIDSSEMIDEDEVLEELLVNYYKKHEDHYKICQCNACTQLILPFLIRKDISLEEELNEIFQSHLQYVSQCSEEFHSNEKLKSVLLKGTPVQKINNIYSKTIWIGEILFKYKPNV